MSEDNLLFFIQRCFSDLKYWVNCTFSCSDTGKQSCHRQSALENKWLKEAVPFIKEHLQLSNIISGTITYWKHLLFWKPEMTCLSRQVKEQSGSLEPSSALAHRAEKDREVWMGKAYNSTKFYHTMKMHLGVVFATCPSSPAALICTCQSFQAKHAAKFKPKWSLELIY